MLYQGSCHCESVKFEAEIELGKVLSCNCSICRRKGSLLTFVPESQFELISGENSLSDYQFNKRVIHHYFCSNCGVSPFGAGKMPDGSPVRAINVRCLDDIDLEKLDLEHFDGKSQ